MGNFRLPASVVARIAEQGDRIRVARIRRGWSVAELAAKAGCNRNTLTALEHGKPGTAFGTFVAVLWALGLDQSLDAVADPDADLHGKALEASRRPSRAGRSRKPRDDYGF